LDCFIKVTVNFEEDLIDKESEPTQPNFLSMSVTDILAKPFNFVSGNVPRHHPLNIFKKNSGWLIKFIPKLFAYENC
jgi:hypothetical protein